ncbi:hypothetical protein Taro_042819 [Colocasia esculenta]|uniref:Uncharacterized protein n=1 Tax=Colocasia esculenta TaxID=4460 RepID=A0A843WEV2_COLES|nr:hypothetical protein [Colocasia esculenta]
MVHGARSSSSSGRSLRGRVLFKASGLGEFTPPQPRVPVAGPSSVSLTVAAGSGQSTPSPNIVVGSVLEDAVSLLEGACSFYESTLREVWINGYSNHRFMHRSDEARSRLVWTMTARSNFKHLSYNARKNAQKVFRSADLTLWRERAPTWMRRDYWETLCNIWAAERWQQTSTIMKVNRVANPEANMHTSGSVSFATHQSRLEKEIKRPPTFQEKSYRQQMTEKCTGEEEQSQLDLEVWVAASGAPKKGHVYGFGHSMNTIRVLSGTSSSASQTSAFSTPAGAAGSSPSEMMGFIADTISVLESRLA